MERCRFRLVPQMRGAVEEWLWCKECPKGGGDGVDDVEEEVVCIALCPALAVGIVVAVVLGTGLIGLNTNGPPPDL